MVLRGATGSSTPSPLRRMEGLEEVKQAAPEAKRLRGSDRPTTKPIKMKQEKKEGKKRELTTSPTPQRRRTSSSTSLIILLSHP